MTQRNAEWLKIKCVQSEGFAIVGYERLADGKLRHASYKALREAADADDIYEID